LRARPEQTQLEDLSDASFLGKLHLLPANVRLDRKVIPRCTHSSLFGLVISNEGNKFYNIDTSSSVDVELTTGCSFLTVRPLQHQRLGEEHPGDADEGDDDKNALDLALAAVDVRIAAALCRVGPEQDHVDEGDEDGGGAALGEPELFLDLVGVVLRPLDEHEESEVAKEAAEEEQLGDELGEDVHGLLEILMIGEGHADAEDHVQDAENDGDLHLEGVQENNLVLSNLPDLVSVSERFLRP